MNSQFSNSNFGRVLYVLIITLIVAATAFVIWYMTAGYKIGTYEPDTRFGSVYIGGLTQEEVYPRMQDKIYNWYEDDTIVFELNYQGYTYEFDRNLLYFDVNASMINLTSGKTNSIIVYYQGSEREGVIETLQELDFLKNVKDNVDFESLVNDIIYDAQLMKSFSVRNVEDYLINPEDSIEVISSASFTLPDGITKESLMESITNVYPDGKIYIEGKSLFDITEVFGAEFSDAPMIILSSAMVETIIPTNFTINERHYVASVGQSYTIDTYPYIGRNVTISKREEKSFSFYNPNAFNYYFEISFDEGDDLNGTLTLNGLPFEYTININPIYTEIPYITQIATQSGYEQPGDNGLIVEIYREIIDIESNVVDESLVLFEYYSPQTEILFIP